MGRYVLGIHLGMIGHDPNICVLDTESNEFWHIEEERLSRKKHSYNIDIQSITYGNNFRSFIKDRLGIDWVNIDHIVVGIEDQCHYNKNDGKKRKYLPDKPETVCNIFDKVVEYHYPLFESGEVIDLNKKMFMHDFYKVHSPSLIKDIYFLNHHIAHGAYTYYTSPYDKSIIFSYDGSGYEESYAMSMFGDGRSLKDFRDYNKLSVGIWYHGLTDGIFKSMYQDCIPSFWEGKTMALASYGMPKYLPYIKKKLYVPGDPFRSFDQARIRTNYGDAYSLIVSVKNFDEFFERHSLILDISEPKPTDIFEYFANVSCSWQVYIEELIEECTRMLRDHYNIRHLCISGGCGLNGLINYKLQNAFEEGVYIPPATSDCGVSIGCAMYGKHVILGKDRCDYGNIAFKGLDYEIDPKLFEKYNLQYYIHDDNDLWRYVSEELRDNKIVGWYQGRSESGPRALGNRSILANPMNPDMKDILNKKVKHRESFRPFAPSIMKEHVNDYFHNVTDEKYMLKIAKVREEKKSVIPSCVHVDGTGRVQTVTRDENRMFYHLLERFYNLTGVPVLLNTSFNVNGEPIVETPEDALKAFLNTEIDVLVLKNYTVRK